MENVIKILKKKETLWLLAILIIAAFFRLHRVRDYIVFLGDEGRDVMVVRRILQGDLAFIGPTASVGGFYLGPVYYYMMAPFLWAFQYDPVGPAYLISFISIATVYLVYLFGKKVFHPVVGLSAALLFATSPLIIRYSRASWNPNPLPFFALLGLFFLWQGLRDKTKLPIYLAGVCLGVAWQLHYLALILTGVYGVVVLDVFKTKKWLHLRFSKKRVKKILSRTLLIVLGWLTTFSPFLAFEIKNNFPNTRTIAEFVTRSEGAVDFKLIDIITSFYARLGRLFAEAFSVNSFVPIISAVAIFLTIVLIYSSRKRSKVLLVWLMVGLAGMAMYQGDIHNYYFGFLFPVPFLMAGILIYQLWIRSWWGKSISIIILTITVGWFIQKSLFRLEPNRIVDQTSDIADIVVDMAGGEPYNFGLISSGNSDHAYRYFLELSDNVPKRLEEEVTSQLIIVCEQPRETCEPRGHPLWEIAGFGRKEVEETRTSRVGEITIIRTIHHESSLDMIGKPATKG